MFQTPHWALAAIWLAWLPPALWCWFNVWMFRWRLRRWDQRYRRREQHGAVHAPRAAVIVAVKGADERLGRHLDALSDQRYPRYRLIYVVESEEDPAYAAVDRYRSSREPGEGGCGDITLLVAGLAERGSQKVWNLCCGVRALKDADEVVAFADADIVPDDRWLVQLVAPLRRKKAAAATGYRWLAPAGGVRSNLPTRLASVINASVATLQGPPRRTHTWGGSTAIDRTTLDEVGVLRHWEGALSDDYQLTRALRGTDRHLHFIPRLLVATPVRFTWRSLFEFARRQYMVTRFYAPVIWLVGLLSTSIYTAGWLSAGAAAAAGLGGWGWGMAAWAVVWAADLGRAAQRRRLVLDVLGERAAADLRRVFTLERWATPLWMALHAVLILASSVGRRITWAGITYEVRGRQDVRIVHRADASASSAPPGRWGGSERSPAASRPPDGA